MAGLPPSGSSSLERSAAAWALLGCGTVVLTGLGALTLGILAVIGLAPMALVLVGLLCLGAGALLTLGLREQTLLPL